MKSIFKATALLGGASAINILIGLISAKVTALLLGPSGFGLMSLYQSVITLTVMVAGLGIPTAVTRAMALALAKGEMQEVVALRRAGWAITIGAALIAMALVAGFAPQINAVMLDGRASADWALFIVPAILFSMLSAVQLGIINARHRVGDLARISVLSALVTLVPTITLTWFFRSRGVAPALAASMLITLVVGYAYYRKGMEKVEALQASPTLLQPSRGLVAFGLPYMASVAVGSGILTILPILVLHVLGPVEVGLFRASSALAVNYLSLILASLAQDYFPRVSAVSDDIASLNQIINDQLHLVLLLAGPVILAMMGAVPFLIPMLYSHKFDGAAAILEWQLIGDLFKFATWTMGFVIMARLGSRIFFLTELFGGLVLLASSWLGMKIWGLPGLGIAFLVTGVVACATNWAVLYYSRRVTWRRDNLLLFCLLALAMAALRMVSLAGMPLLNLGSAAVLAAGFGAYSLFAIVREFGGLRAFLVGMVSCKGPSTNLDLSYGAGPFPSNRAPSI
jgi:enterobacterial common antigen flippase